MTKRGARVRELAEGVHCITLGRGIAAVNVYLVRSGSSLVLVDAGWRGSAAAIRAAVEVVAGPGSRPTAILLTHIHPDHSGAALELARGWGLRLLVHPDEVALARGGIVPELANPLDRRLVAPVLRLVPRRRLEALIERDSLEQAVEALGVDLAVPGLPDWRCIPVPGHTPGHVALFRERDRVLLTGDAVLTTPLLSPRHLLSREPVVCGPPRISTWDWSAATTSVTVLATLRPEVLASGHGRPISGPDVADRLGRLAASL